MSTCLTTKFFLGKLPASYMMILDDHRIYSLLKKKQTNRGSWANTKQLQALHNWGVFDYVSHVYTQIRACSYYQQLKSTV